MGQVHNELRKGTLSDAVKRALGVTREGGVERYGETLTPILNPWGMPEWAYLRNDYLFTLAMSATAVAAEFSIMALANPAGSNQVVVVDGVNVLSNSVAQQFQLVFVTEAVALATLGAVSRATARDQRAQVERASPTFLLNINALSGTDAVGFTGNVLERISANAGASFAQLVTPPYIVKPGMCLAVQAGTVNLSCQANFFGRLRAAYPGELV